MSSEDEFHRAFLRRFPAPLAIRLGKHFQVLFRQFEGGLDADSSNGISHAAPVRQFQIRSLSVSWKFLGLFHTIPLCRASEIDRTSPERPRRFDSPVLI